MIPVGEAWNGKFVQVGNGGLAGRIPDAQVKLRAESGYASAGTDDGHGGNGRTAIWALGHPEKVVDFGTRSLKETTDDGQAADQGAEGCRAHKRSYFVGCSAGGREALMEAQRFPGDFDGIVAGAAANYDTLMYGGRVYMQQALSRPGGYLGDGAACSFLQAAALKQCADGGAFIRDQMACHFDPASLRCKPGQTEGCLTAPQIASAKAIYGGRLVGGKAVFPGYPPGAEAAPTNSWRTWNTGTSLATWPEASAHEMSSQLMKYFIYGDPSLDFLKMDTGAKYDRDRQKAAAILDAVDPDLTPFAKHGGKLIQYHGWNDPAVPPMGSVRYFDAVNRKMGDAASFYRLYMIPGMLHCQGGAGPGAVDWLSILDRWVEDKARGRKSGNREQPERGDPDALPLSGRGSRKSGDGWSLFGRGRRAEASRAEARRRKRRP